MKGINNFLLAKKVGKITKKSLLCTTLSIAAMVLIMITIGLIAYNVIDYPEQINSSRYKDNGCDYRVAAIKKDINYNNEIDKIIDVIDNRLESKPSSTTINFRSHDGYGSSEALPIYLVNGSAYTGVSCALVIPEKMPSADIGKVFLSSKGKADYERDMGGTLSVGDKLSVSVGMNKSMIQELTYAGASEDNNYIMADSINVELVSDLMISLDIKLRYNKSGEYKDNKALLERNYFALQQAYGKENVVSEVIANYSQLGNDLATVLAIILLALMSTIGIHITKKKYVKAVRNNESIKGMIEADQYKTMNVATVTAIQLAFAIAIALVIASVIAILLVPLLTLAMRSLGGGSILRAVYPIWLPFVIGGMLYGGLAISVAAKNISDKKKLSQAVASEEK